MRNQRPKLFCTPGILRFQQWGGKYGGSPAIPQPYPTAPRTLFTETFPYNVGGGAPADLATASAARWASVLGGILVPIGGGYAYPNSASQYRATDTLAAWDLTKAWTATATLTLSAASQAASFGFEAGNTAAITTEVNSGLNPAIIRTFNGAGANSGNFSLGALTGTWLVSVHCSATRLLTVSVNGSPLYTYQLLATTGSKQVNILFTGAVSTERIANLKLTQP